MPTTEGQSMPASCDVAVIGGGLEGALVAHKLAAADLRVVVLETQDCVGGASAQGFSVALLGTPEPYTALVERLGKQSALDVWHLTYHNLEILAALGAQLNVEVRRTGSFRLTDERALAAQYQRSADLLSDAGFPVALGDASEMGMLVGLQSDMDLSFDARALIHALLAHPHITVQTGTEVKALRPGADDVEIWAQKHYLKAKAVVLAAGAHTVHLDAVLAKLLEVVPFHAVDCLASDNLEMPLLLENGQVLVRQLDPYWQFLACPVLPAEDSRSLLSRTAERFYPEAKVANRYVGWVAQGEDGLPVVGDLPDLPHVYVASGLGPWGDSWAFVAAEHLVELMFREEDPGLLNLHRLLG